MPYVWTMTDAEAPGEPGASRLSPEGWELRLWPHRSLPAGGFVAFIAATAGMLALPLLAVLGSPVLWGLLPFLMLALGGVWLGIARSNRDARLCEVLRLGPAQIALARHDPGRAEPRCWQANPHWVRATLHHAGGPVPDYLTLSGGGREVELGAFLAPEERVRLHEELSARLAALR
jgi:uncharacterized membrane protein